MTFVLWMTAKLNAAKQMPTPTAAKMKTSTPDILACVQNGVGVRRCGARRPRGGRAGPRLLLRACARRGEADIQLGGPKLGTRRGVCSNARSVEGAFQNMCRGAAVCRHNPLCARPRTAATKANFCDQPSGRLSPDVSGSGPEGNIGLQRIEIVSEWVLNFVRVLFALQIPFCTHFGS